MPMVAVIQYCSDKWVGEWGPLLTNPLILTCPGSGRDSRGFCNPADGLFVGWMVWANGVGWARAERMFAPSLAICAGSSADRPPAVCSRCCRRMAICRVAGPRCRGPAPSEPDVTIARHPAQASAGRSDPAIASRRLPSRSSRCRSTPSAPARRSVRFAPSNVSSDSGAARPPNRRDHGGSRRPFGPGIPSSPRPCPPHYRAAFACSAAPLPPPPSPPLRSGYRHLTAAGRMGLTLLSNVEKRMGRLRPIVRRVVSPPSSRVPLDEPTRMPFWPRPVSTFGRSWMTDLNHGRSLAFSLPSSARPPPAWCCQIEAVVPGASHVGLLLRMSG